MQGEQWRIPEHNRETYLQPESAQNSLHQAVETSEQTEERLKIKRTRMSAEDKRQERLWKEKARSAVRSAAETRAKTGKISGY